MFLRELVRYGLDRDVLAQEGGVWRWRGAVEAGRGLAELVDLRIEDAGERARRVLELVPVGAPLELGLLEPGELEGLELLERRELVQRVLAERLARAAVQAGGGFGARLTLGRALAGAGRADEAQAMFAALEPEADGDEDRAAVAMASARNLFWGLDRAEEADAVLRKAEEQVAAGDLRQELAAQRIRLRLHRAVQSAH